MGASGASGVRLREPGTPLAVSGRLCAQTTERPPLSPLAPAPAAGPASQDVLVASGGHCPDTQTTWGSLSPRLRGRPLPTDRAFASGFRGLVWVPGS